MTPHSPHDAQAAPLDALLASYAAGTLSMPMHVMVRSHLEISPANRGYVAALEASKAAMMDAGDIKPLANRDAALEAIFSRKNTLITPSADVLDPVFPAALRHYLNTSSSDIRWRFRLPGIKEFRFAESGRGDVSLFWIRAGRKMPSHTHEGQEATLLLRGGFTDPSGHYRRGDIAVADAELDHHPVADADEDCICFAVTDAPLTMTGPIAWMLRKFTRH